MSLHINQNILTRGILVIFAILVLGPTSYILFFTHTRKVARSDVVILKAEDFGGRELELVRNDKTLLNKVKILDPVMHYNKELGMTVVTFYNELSYIYTPNDEKTLLRVAKNKKYSYLFNGSFFGGNKSEIGHAGLLQIEGDLITSKKGGDEANQLTHVVVVKNSGELDFVPYDKYKAKNCSECTAFQTGPLVIKDNKIKYRLIENSINGNRLHERTLLGFTDDGKKYFITVRKEVDLASLAEKILSYKIFKGKKLSLINLDGGSSAAMYSRKYPKYNFNVKKKLPIIIGI